MNAVARYPVLCAWLILATLATFPYARAVAYPPPGRSFVGTFHWIDDVHSYLAYAQQAEDGHVFLRNKFGERAVRAPRPRLVNVEWTLVGWLSRVLGREPHLAFRMMGLLAGLGVLVVVDAWLLQAGLPAARRFPALLLVGAGGSFGGLLFLFTDFTVERCVDLSHGMSTFTGLLSNAHWTATLALTLGALYAFARFDDRPRAFWYGGLLGNALAFVRPYDVISVIVARVAAVVIEDPRGIRRLLPLLTLAPGLAYQAWVFFGNSAYGMHASPAFAAAAPSRADTLLAVAPLVAMAVPGLPRVRAGDPWRWTLAAWAAFGTILVLLRPTGFAMRYAPGLAVPFLCLGALWLANLKPRWLALALVTLSSSAPIAVWMACAPDQWFVPRERWLVANAVRGVCASGDRLLSPPDIGLYASAFAACDVYVGYATEEEYPRRMDALRWFYANAPSPMARLQFLESECVTHVVLPGIPGPRAEPWLPAEAGFARVAGVTIGHAVSLYRRTLPPSCAR